MMSHKMDGAVWEGFSRADGNDVRTDRGTVSRLVAVLCGLVMMVAPAVLTVGTAHAESPAARVAVFSQEAMASTPISAVAAGRAIRTGSSPALSLSWGWNGGPTAYLNRNETKNAIQWGTSVASLIPAARVVQVLTWAIGTPAAGYLANWAVDRGYCLAITNQAFSTRVYPWVYRC